MRSLLFIIKTIITPCFRGKWWKELVTFVGFQEILKFLVHCKGIFPKNQVTFYLFILCVCGWGMKGEILIILVANILDLQQKVLDRTNMPCPKNCVFCLYNRVVSSK